MQIEDIIGKRYNNYTVVREVEKSNDGHRRFLCKCDCGNERIVYLSHLKTNRRKECELCSFKNINKKHGMKNSRIYRIWGGMKNRCNNNNSKDFKNYKKRGIKVCPEWNNDFSIFYNWALQNGYSDTLTIERIDVNGNYTPENCKWVPKELQQRNKTTNILINYNGATITASELAHIVGIKPSAMIQRIKRHGVDDYRIYQKVWRAC